MGESGRITKVLKAGLSRRSSCTQSQLGPALYLLIESGRWNATKRRKCEPPSYSVSDGSHVESLPISCSLMLPSELTDGFREMREKRMWMCQRGGGGTVAAMITPRWLTKQNPHKESVTVMPPQVGKLTRVKAKSHQQSVTTEGWVIDLLQG